MTPLVRDGYVLSRTPEELDRLDAQGVLYREVTRRTLIEAGIGPGMRVLDLGSGSGDLAFLAAELVGDDGAVVGIDSDPDTVQAAARRAVERGIRNVSLRVTGSGAPADEAPFDALVGRFVLMHQADPASVLGAAARNVRANGAVAFVESSMTSLLGGVHSHPYSPLYDQVVRWTCAVVGAGADLAAGLRLPRVFLDAGLPAPLTRLDAPVEGGPDSPLYEYLAAGIRSLLPQARKVGIAGFDEAAVDSLADRLRDQVVAGGGVLVVWPVVSAWCRIGAGPSDWRG